MQDTVKIALLSTLISFPGNTAASDILLTHTHTYTPIELKLVSPSYLYKTASVCFLGGSCGTEGKFNQGDQDMTVDTAEMCKRDGYSVIACTPPLYVHGQCPHNPDYYQECREDIGRACNDADYYTSCDDGKVADETQTCPYDSSYKKCKCNPCDGYAYTYTEAVSEGYAAGASCNSCGTVKYQRQNAPCNGFLSCECGGEIGATTCKSGSNTLFSSCKECIKCSDECPEGYYKTAGGTWSYSGSEGRMRCNFGQQTSQTECGTTCYQCLPPFSGGLCLSDCPEGYIFNNQTHDYHCNPNTCRNKIKAKYPNYFYGSNNGGCVSNKYNFDRPYVGESGNAYYSGDWCYLKPNEISHSFFVEADFSSEFSECNNYCRPSTEIVSKTFKGDVFLGISSVSSYNAKAFYDITIDGTLTLPEDARKEFIKLTLKTNAQLKLKAKGPLGYISGSLEDVVLYPGSTIESINSYSYLYETTVAGNTADTAVTLKNLKLNGNITSAHLLAGTPGGLYLNLYPYEYADMSKHSILRNPGGKINVTLKATEGYSDTTLTLFENPGIDTVVTIPQKSSNFHGSRCVALAQDKNKKLCSGTGGKAVITFLTDEKSIQVLPACCSRDSGCTAWNTGTVKCEGYSEQ